MKYLVVGRYTTGVHFYRLSDGQEVWRLPVLPLGAYYGSHRLALTSDATIATTFLKGVLCRLDVPKGTLLSRSDLKFDHPYRLVLSADDRYILIGERDAIRLFVADKVPRTYMTLRAPDVLGGIKEVAEREFEYVSFTDCAFTSDPNLLVTTANTAFRRLLLFVRWRSTPPTSSVVALEDAPTALASAPVDAMVALAQDKVLTVMDFNGKALHSLAVAEPIHTMAFSPSGAYLAFAEGRLLHLLEPRSWTTCARISCRHEISSIAFASDESFVAVGLSNGTASLISLDRPSKTALTNEELWDSLLSNDGDRVLSAISSFAARSDEAVAFLDGRIRGLSSSIETLVAQLDDDTFRLRQEAEAALRRHPLATAGVLDVLAKKDSTSTEAKLRLTRLADAKRDAKAVHPEALRLSRAVHILQRIHTAKSLALVEQLSRSADSLPCAPEAAAAARRLRTILPK
jgi:hypothetical protein